ncbi:hypothetical protein ACOMHN_066333 [Nucella lapillus]
MSQRFINAAKDGYLDMLVQATKRDLNVADEDGMTAVMWAAHNGHLDALRIIVGRGDLDIISPSSGKLSLVPASAMFATALPFFLLACS